jgi:hypothetical protein
MNRAHIYSGTIELNTDMQKINNGVIKCLGAE